MKCYISRLKVILLEAKGMTLHNFFNIDKNQVSLVKKKERKTDKEVSENKKLDNAGDYDIFLTNMHQVTKESLIKFRTL